MLPRHIPRVHSQAALGRAALQFCQFPHKILPSRCFGKMHARSCRSLIETSGPVVRSNLHPNALLRKLRASASAYNDVSVLSLQSLPPPTAALHGLSIAFLSPIFNSGTAALQTNLRPFVFFVPSHFRTSAVHPRTHTHAPTPTQPTHPHTFHSH